MTSHASTNARVDAAQLAPRSARSAVLHRTMPRHMMARCCEPFPLPSALAGPVTFDITSNYTHVPTMRDDVAHDGRRAKLPGGGEACFDARCRACRRRFHAGVSRVPAPTTSPCHALKFFLFSPRAIFRRYGCRDAGPRCALCRADRGAIEPRHAGATGGGRGVAR